MILFHAGLEFFSGGFVGVDIFFVISGYLITTILLEDIEHKRLSILNFYERRIRRIFPALFLVMLICIPFAWALMNAAQMRDFAASLFSTSVFLSNFYFLSQAGYFSPESEYQPLLHTWSLSVEEQYYLFFPLLLATLVKRSHRSALMVITLLCVASFLVAEWGWRENPSRAFFFSLTRFWELLVGSIAAFILWRQNVTPKNLYSALGLAAITISIFLYDQATPFPSIYTLLPVGGTALIICFAGQGTIVGQFLKLRVLVGIGLISYSAYLWHQPVFAFARLFQSGAPRSEIMLALVLLSLILAYITWRFVETPCRRKDHISRPLIFGISATGFVFFTSFGLWGYSTDGFRAPTNDEAKSISFSLAPSLSADIWVVGDSHGEHLIHGLSHATTGQVKGILSPGCIPLRDVDRYDYRFRPGDCARTMNAALDKVIAEDPKALIILASMGPVYLDGATFKGKDPARITGLGVELVTDSSLRDRWAVFEIGLRQTFTEFSVLENAQPIFVIDVPELGIDQGCQTDTKAINTAWFNIDDPVEPMSTDSCYVTRAEYDERTSRYRALVYSVASEFPRIRIFDPTDVFCSKSRCSGFTREAGFLYRDADHLSESGSQFWAAHFVSWLLESRK